MGKLAGITDIKNDKYSVFWINDFSDDLKEAIREQLAVICHGEDNVRTGRVTYNYKNTVREFLKRYRKKPKKIKIGMIGELLVHILVHNYFDEYKTVTPYFNMEERSIKKGYDAVLTETAKPNLWIIEVKSGQLHKYKNANQTIIDLIDTAKNDLNDRFNDENTSLWLEAINGAKISFDSCNTMKEAVVGLLMDWSDSSTEGTYTSKDKNVFLSAVLFSKLSDPVTEKTINTKQGTIETSGDFKQVFVMAVQKETFYRIQAFLKAEAK